MQLTVPLRAVSDRTLEISKDGSRKGYGVEKLYINLKHWRQRGTKLTARRDEAGPKK